MRYAIVVVVLVLAGGVAWYSLSPSKPQAPPQVFIKGKDTASVVELDTSKGKIQIQLFRKKAPNTVANFLAYVRAGFYNGTIFHRVKPEFVVQGGGFLPGMTKKQTGKPIKNEADNGLLNKVGTVAMARKKDPHSATSQFFINAKDNSMLDHESRSYHGWGYCVFGKVIKGMDVVKDIQYVKTTIVGFRADIPVETILIKSVKILR